jgi:hypothetical protein
MEWNQFLIQIATQNSPVISPVHEHVRYSEEVVWETERDHKNVRRTFNNNVLLQDLGLSQRGSGFKTCRIWLHFDCSQKTVWLTNQSALKIEEYKYKIK